MKNILIPALLCLLVSLAACSPYRVHHKPARAGKKASHANVSFLNFQPRSGCGCH